MTLRLSVHRSRWRAHVDLLRTTVPDLVPVVKGNGYGFDRAVLAAEAAGWAPEVALGTLHELPAHNPQGTRWAVLTPSLDPPAALAPWAIPTVGRAEHVHALAAVHWSGGVHVKLRSSMRRYGAAPDELPTVLEAVRAAGLTVHAFVLHPPLAADGSPEEAANVAEIEAWLPVLAPATPVSVSHIGPTAYLALRERHPQRSFRLRSGTALWHGDKAAFHLSADVLDVRRIDADQPAGYRRRPVPGDGHLVMIGAGTAHGVTPLAEGLSPFHHARRRLALVESPHMHTSMVFVPDGEPVPALGDRVDVQRPLTGTAVDELVWHDD
jgi:alanine racemase